MHVPTKINPHSPQRCVDHTLETSFVYRAQVESAWTQGDSRSDVPLAAHVHDRKELGHHPACGSESSDGGS